MVVQANGGLRDGYITCIKADAMTIMLCDYNTVCLHGSLRQ